MSKKIKPKTFLIMEGTANNSKKSVIKQVLIIATGVVIAALAIKGGEWGMKKITKS